MDILGILKNLVFSYKKIDIKKLPSQGYFYPDDMEIKIKKVDIEDIIVYERSFDPDDLFSVITNIKNIIYKNVILNKEYKYEDIKSADIVYLFFEVVKHSMNKSILVKYNDNKTNEEKELEFNSSTFNYFDFSQFSYDKSTREFLLNGYRYSFPSLGVETDFTNYLADVITEKNIEEFNTYNYDFMYFTGNKSRMTYSEIDNLVTIFNFDIDDNEKDLIKDVVKSFSPVMLYTLKVDNQLVDVRSKIDLLNIWKN